MEAIRSDHGKARVHPAFRDGAVPRRVQRDDLLHGHRAALGKLGGERVADVAVLVDQPARASHAGAVTQQPRPRRLGDADAGLVGLDFELDHLIAGGRGPDNLEVAVVQRAVALHAGVDDATVEAGTDLELASPVLGLERRLEGGQMHVAHVNEAALGQPCAAPVGVLPAHVPGENAAADVELVAVGEEINLRRVEPLPAGDAEAERQPVRHVDKILVLDRAARDRRAEAVVKASDVGARVMNLVGTGLRVRTAGREVPVAQGAQRFT